MYLLDRGWKNIRLGWVWLLVLYCFLVKRSNFENFNFKYKVIKDNLRVKCVYSRLI